MRYLQRMNGEWSNLEAFPGTDLVQDGVIEELMLV